ncbi:MAG TPA: hypothetical protein PKW90_02110 [Myxococcota bacterium]|nr:hypothetical protein [Myxococcota bacterium]
MSPDVELAGYAELRSSVYIGSEGFPLTMVERVRPTLEARPAERLAVHVAVEGALAQGRDNSAVAADLIAQSPIQDVLDEGGCVYDPPPKYATSDSYLSVERLHLDIQLPAIDIAIGRQAVTWGSSLITHPTDPFPEVVATEPWRERRGVNAIKAEIPIKSHSITALVALDDDLSEFYAEKPKGEDIPLTGAVRGTVRALETDWSAVAWGRPDGRYFAGVDLRGTLGVGWWVEGGWHGGRDATHDDAAPVEVVAGIDYSIPVLNMLYFAAEYRYDGTGEDPDHYSWASRNIAGEVPYSGCSFSLTPSGEELQSRSSLGRHYVHATARLGFTEDFALSGVTIVNLQDATGFASVDASLLVGSHWTIHAGAQIPYGKEGEYRPPESVTTLRVGTNTADLSPLLFDANTLAWVRYSF